MSQRLMGPLAVCGGLYPERHMGSVSNAAVSSARARTRAQLRGSLAHATTCTFISLCSPWGPVSSLPRLLLTLGRALKYDSLMLTALMWGRTIGSTQRLLALARGLPPPVEPPYATKDGELTSEVVDLRLPPSHYEPSPGSPELETSRGTSGGVLSRNTPAKGDAKPAKFWDRGRTLIVPEHPHGSSAREAFARLWAEQVLQSSPPRISLRDPLNPEDETLAARCDFNASGRPTVRLACFGHVSWRVRDETQRQQTCTTFRS